MNISDFDYPLPQSSIAQHPTQRRDASRLLVLNRNSGDCAHTTFASLPSLLEPGDTLVVNNTRVIPARLMGTKRGGGASIELLLLEEQGDNRWKVLAYRAKRLRPGVVVDIDPQLSATIEEELDEGQFIVRFDCEGNWDETLERLGHIPLPPYISRENGDLPEDRERYQTVYAVNSGSSAAPTAGLHFTAEVLDACKQRGVKLTEVTLHVGLDTFRPVLVEDLSDHKMHSEYYSLTKETAGILNQTQASGGRIVAVGTTSVRVLETCANEAGVIQPGAGHTSIFILPGHRFKGIDAMLTNFHLPRSTLLAMVSAFAGRESILRTYQEAIEQGYRFFSYGDAMFIA
jgi:S-adenosylmethionine:tRNA ribosyltransferase-isomerase